MESGRALRPGLMAGFRGALPRRVGADRGLGVAVGLGDEAGAVRDLRRGRVLAEVPDLGHEQVLARLQERPEVERLEAPIVEVAAGGADAHALAVERKDEALIGAHVHGEMSGHLGEVEDLAEAVDARVAVGSARAGDPLRLPRAVHHGVGHRQPICGSERTRRDDQASGPGPQFSWLFSARRAEGARAAYFFVRKPMPCIHAAQTDGQVASAGSLGARPTPCGPFA